MNLESYTKAPFNLVNRWSYVLCGTLFLIAFLVIYTPFDLQKTFYSAEDIGFISVFFTLSEGLSTFLSLAFSQFFLRNKLFKANMTVRKYVMLFFIESALIVLLLAICGNIFLRFYVLPTGIEHNLIQNQFLNSLYIYSVHLFILVFPFIGVLFFSGLNNLNSEKKELKEEIIHLKKETPSLLLKKELNILNENDAIELKLSLNDLLFLESNNQYVMVYYIKNDKISKKIVRNRLKKIIEQLREFKIHQCHRSYGINLHKASAIKIIGGNKYITFIDSSDIKVPISKTYYLEIKQLLHTTI